MGPIDIIILVAAVGAVVGFAAYSVWKKKTGRSTGCGCGCDCSSCSSCPAAKKKGEDKDA